MKKRAIHEKRCDRCSEFSSKFITICLGCLEELEQKETD